MDISESQLKIAALSHSTMETFIYRSIPAPLENHRGRVPGGKAGQQRESRRGTGCNLLAPGLSSQVWVSGGLVVPVCGIKAK